MVWQVSSNIAFWVLTTSHARTDKGKSLYFPNKHLWQMFVFVPKATGKKIIHTFLCVWFSKNRAKTWHYPDSALWIPGLCEFLPARRATSQCYLLAFHSLTSVCFFLGPPLPRCRSEKWHKSFLTFPLQRQTKATPLKLRGKYECHSVTKQSYNFLPPTISPWIIKSEKQKPNTLRRGQSLFFSPFLSFGLFFLPGRKTAVHYIQSP